MKVYEGRLILAAVQEREEYLGSDLIPFASQVSCFKKEKKRKKSINFVREEN